jgi:predicted transcriptional regulator
MNTETGDSGSPEENRLERAIVLQLLRDDHGRRWTRDELKAELDAEASAIELALARLATNGVVEVEEAHICASQAARRIDGLGLIGI